MRTEAGRRHASDLLCYGIAMNPHAEAMRGQVDSRRGVEEYRDLMQG